jgi:hypothetical protein
MAASLRVGLTVTQLRRVSEVLAARGEAEAARRSSEALTQALGTQKGTQ